MSYLTTPMATSAVFKKLKEEHNFDAPTHHGGGDTDKDKSLPSIKRRAGAGGRGQGAGGGGRGRKGRKGAEKEGEAVDCDLEDTGVAKEAWSPMAYPLMCDGLVTQAVATRQPLMISCTSFCTSPLALRKNLDPLRRLVTSTTPQ